MNKQDLLQNVRKISIIFVQALVITGITVFAVEPLSCKVTSSGIEIIGGDYSAPVLQNISVIDEETVVLAFSEEVDLTAFVVSPVIAEVSDSDEHSESIMLSPALCAASGEYGKIDCQVDASENKQKYTFNLLQKTKAGKKYEILGVVKDRIGNSLTFSVPFTGYNSHIPELIMTEIHTGMCAQIEKEKEKNIRRLEYIEFLALSDGNLAGLELCSSYYGESKKYEFPALEIKAGEYFVLHLRNWGEGCISEEEEDLALAFSEYTDDKVRDLWTSETSRIIGEKTDIIVLRNYISGKIIDAVMYRDDSVVDWSKLKTDYTSAEGFSNIYSSTDDNFIINSTKLTASYALLRTDKTELRNSILKNIKINYPVEFKKDSWSISKPTLPLKQ